MSNSEILRPTFTNSARLKEIIERLLSEGKSQKEIDPLMEQYEQLSGAECTLSDI